MQVRQHRQEVVDEESATRTVLEQGEDLPIENLILPNRNLEQAEAFKEEVTRFGRSKVADTAESANNQEMIL